MKKNLNSSLLIQQIVKFAHFSEKAKYTNRSSKTSIGTRDNVASHSWRMSLLALLIIPNLNAKICLEKTLKLIIIHDLAELKIGDVNILDLIKNPDLAKEQHMKEYSFFKSIAHNLPKSLATEFLNLWIEYEQKDTYESKVANAIDKIEAQLQNNESRSNQVIKELEKIGKLDEIKDLFNFDAFINQIFNFCLEESVIFENIKI